MADSKINTNDLGNYEIPLTANQVYVIDTSAITGNVTVVVHKGNAPVYAKVASSVTVRDNTATMIRPGSTGTVNTVSTALALVTATDAVVSVTKA